MQIKRKSALRAFSRRTTNPVPRQVVPETSLGPVSTRSFGSPSRIEVKEHFTSAENQQLYHNASNGTTSGAALVQVNPLNNLSQGVEAYKRIGDKVFVKEIDVAFWLSNKLDRPNVMYRVIGLYSTGLSASTAPAFSLVLQNGSANHMISYPNHDHYTLFYDKVINPNAYCNTISPSAATGKERSYLHNIKHRFNAPVSYAGTQTSTSTVYFAVIAYDAYGSLVTDNIASFAYSSRVLYTDD